MTAIVVASATGCALSTAHVPFRSVEQTKQATGGIARTLALARLSERHGQTEQAMKIYESVLANEPDHLVAHHRLGVVFTKRQQFDIALQHFKRAEELGPPNSELLSDIGYLLYLQHDLAGAEQQLRRAVVADRNNRAAHNNLGLVLGEQGKMHEAHEQFQLAGTPAEAYANLAYVQSQAGLLHEAETNYHRALELDSNLRVAAKALVQVASRTGSLRTHVARPDIERLTRRSYTAPANEAGAPQARANPTADHPVVLTSPTRRATGSQIEFAANPSAGESKRRLAPSDPHGTTQHEIKAPLVNVQPTGHSRWSQHYASVPPARTGPEHSSSIPSTVGPDRARLVSHWNAVGPSSEAPPPRAAESPSPNNEPVGQSSSQR